MGYPCFAASYPPLVGQLLVGSGDAIWLRREIAGDRDFVEAPVAALTHVWLVDYLCGRRRVGQLLVSGEKFNIADPPPGQEVRREMKRVERAEWLVRRDLVGELAHRRGELPHVAACPERADLAGGIGELFFRRRRQVSEPQERTGGFDL